MNPTTIHRSSEDTSADKVGITTGPPSPRNRKSFLPARLLKADLSLPYSWSPLDCSAVFCSLEQYRLLLLVRASVPHDRMRLKLCFVLVHLDLHCVSDCFVYVWHSPMIFSHDAHCSQTWAPWVGHHEGVTPEECLELRGCQCAGRKLQ